MTPANSPPTSLELYLRLLGYVKPYKWVFSVAIIAMIVTALTEASFAALLKPILDNGFVDPDPAFIRFIPLLLVLVIVLRAIAGFAASYGMSWIGRRVVFDLRHDAFTRLLILPSDFYEDHSSASLVSKLIYDVENATTATTDAVTMLTRDSFMALAMLAWLFYLDWQLTLVFLIVTPVIAIGIRLASKRFRTATERIQDSVGDIAHVAKEAIQGQRVVKTYGGEAYETERFAVVNNRNRHQSMKKAAISAAMVPIVLLIVGLAVAMMIYIALTRSGAEGITAGTFASYLGTVLMLMSPLKRLAKINEKIQTGVAAASSIFALCDAIPEQDDGTLAVPHASGKIEFRDVHFSYERIHDAVLVDVSFSIEPGETVALVGMSGSGKSTIASLLLRFYRPTRGQILLDGTDINGITMASLRHNIAIVTQETILFDDTVRNNIVYGSEREPDDRLVRSAASAAHVLEFADSMPDGLDTLIGEHGVRLSGGQRQRIAIARALYKDAPILILDEATSSLDSISERLVQDATQRLMANRTTLIIAHRFSTIESADRIWVLDKGHIVESGRHHELLAKDGRYARLYHSQHEPQSQQQAV
ncbi:MAG: lipid A export permease/ATP-binding protein MsbA [Gammaproteobacteria bacterium]|nr:lipid A export permease/ATP-binding protein MsbA [Gammaproteobacteria bacterium]